VSQASSLTGDRGGQGAPDGSAASSAGERGCRSRRPSMPPWTAAH